MRKLCKAKEREGIKHFPLKNMQKGFLGGSDGKESAYNAGDLGRKDPLEKGMATNSRILAWRILCMECSILAWEISWTEEPSPWGCKDMGTAERLTL